MANDQNTAPPKAAGGANTIGSGGIFWATGDETVIAGGDMDTPAEIHYHFPVEIEVRTSVAQIDHEPIIQAALERLANELRSV